MQSSKTPSPPSAAVTSPRAPSTSGRQRRIGARTRVAIASASAICLLILAVVVAVLHATGASSAKPQSVPADWQTYRDPAGLFSLRLPPGWTAQVTVGAASIANGGGNATEKTELIVFSDPAHGPSGARVTVFAEPIRTDFERQWYCRGRTQQRSTFHNLPAEHYDSTWIFSTAGAHFQLIAGAAGSEGAAASPSSTGAKATPAATATSRATSMTAAEQSTVELIVGSFQATNASPLAC